MTTQSDAVYIQNQRCNLYYCYSIIIVVILIQTEGIMKKLPPPLPSFLLVKDEEKDRDLAGSHGSINSTW